MRLLGLLLALGAIAWLVVTVHGGDGPFARAFPVLVWLAVGFGALRVLLTAAQTPPAGDVARELSQVQEALASLGDHVRVAVEPHLTPARFQRLLREGFHIWHFVGHATLSGVSTTEMPDAR